MKKIIFGLLMVITLGIFSTTTVYAEPETGWNPPIVRGTIVINWRDYKDHSTIRPEEITIGLTNSNTGEIIKTTTKERIKSRRNRRCNYSMALQHTITKR